MHQGSSSRRLRWLAAAAPAMLGAAWLATAGAAHAQAQPAPAASNDTIGEVVVTAQFREQNLQKTPLAITAVNAEMLQQRSQTDVSQVAAQAPNVTLEAAGGQGSSSMVAFIRGVGQTDFNFALEPGVGIYVDDVYYATLAGSLLDLLDVDRVEVLRGPQGTLAGKNSIGGAIKLYTKKPVGQGGYLQGTYGSLNRIEVRGAADFTLVPDKLFARLSGATKHRDGYIERIDYACSHPGSGLPTDTVGSGCELGTLGGTSYNAAKLALRWVASERVEVNLSADAINDQSEAVANTLLYADNRGGVSLNGVPYDCRFVPYGAHSCDPNHPNNPYITYASFIDHGFPGFTSPSGNNRDPYVPVAFTPINHFKAWGASAIIDWKLSDTMSLRSITAFRYYRNDFTDDTDGSPIGIEQLYQRLDHREWSQELRLNGSFGRLVDYTVGGFAHTQHGSLQARVDLPYVPGIPAPPPVQQAICGQAKCYGPLNFVHGPDTTPSHTKALFAHATGHLTEQLNVSAGVRYSLEDKTYTYHRHNPDGTVPQACVGGPFDPANPPNCSLYGINDTSARYPQSGEAKRWDWRVDADYHFTPDFMLYGQVSTGYKGGGVNPRPFYKQQELQFGPETLTAYEGGFKTQLFNRRMRLNGAAFYNDYNDIILTLSSCPLAGAPAPTPCALPSNVGAAHVKGAELETEIHPVRGLEMDGSLSYLSFHYTKIAPATNVRPDMVTPYTPMWKWSFGVQYEIPVGSGGASLTPRLDGSYQSTIYTQAINCGPARPATPTQGAVCTVPDANRIGGYAVFNGRITYRAAGGDWSASLEVTNLFNKVYYSTLFDSTSAAGYEAATPGLPREWAITVRKTF